MNWGAKLENNNITVDDFELFLKKGVSYHPFSRKGIGKG
jgi:hypothetical protein